MKLLIVAATDMELTPFKQCLLKRENISFAVCGVGIVATIYNLSRLQLRNGGYDMVVNVGIAGTYSSALSLGQAVAVQREYFDNFGMETANGDFNPFSGYNLNCPHLHDYDLLQSLPQVYDLTVSLLTERKATVELRRATFAADIETMEGAAFFYVCLRENVPFIELRGISNLVGIRDKSQWETVLALENLTKVVLQLADA
jgi:futalosine hydrolase